VVQEAADQAADQAADLEADLEAVQEADQAADLEVDLEADQEADLEADLAVLICQEETLLDKISLDWVLQLGLQEDKMPSSSEQTALYGINGTKVVGADGKVWAEYLLQALPRFPGDRTESTSLSEELTMPYGTNGGQMAGADGKALEEA